MLHPDYSTLLPGKLEPVHKSAQWKGVINEGSQWFYVNYKNAEKILRDVFKSYKSYTDGARKQAYQSRTEFSIKKMNSRLQCNNHSVVINQRQATDHGGH